MNKLFILLVFILFGIEQSKAQLHKDEVQLAQAIWGVEKRKIITDFMKLSDAESTLFWPIYDAYQTEVKKLGETRINITSDYFNNVAQLSNEKADEIATKLLQNNIEVDKLQMNYYKKFKKQLSPLRAAQFIQLDIYLITKMRSELQSTMPLIENIDKTAK